MTDLFTPDDVACMVGCLEHEVTKQRIPLFLADYGKDKPSMSEMMSRYRKITLDINPLPRGEFTYIITGDRIVIDLDTPTLDRVLKEDTAQGMLKELARKGTPDFSITYDVDADTHEMFAKAREAMLGSWLLVLLAEDATEFIINPQNVVVSRTKKPRAFYER